MSVVLMASPAFAGNFEVDSNGTVAAFGVATDGADTLSVEVSTECGAGLSCLSITGVSGTTVTYAESGAAAGDQCLQNGPESVFCIAESVGGGLGAQDDRIYADGPFRMQVDGGGGNDSISGSDTHVLDDELIGGDGDDLLSGYDGNDILDAGPGNDKVNPSPGNDTITGGIGDDLLYGQDGNDTIDAGPGNDRLYGGKGNDALNGGDGDDEFEKAVLDDLRGDIEGADIYRGGPGFDALNLEGVSGNRVITLGDGANDGTSGEGDDVGNDLESIRGGFGNDTITGDGNANVLIGDRGDDIIRGGGGNDVLDGREDTDQVFGEDGDDTVRGGSGADMIDGGGGTDVLEADPVGCQNICANGNDVVNARDGIAEAVSCGGGADRLIADALDIAPSDSGQICEVVERDGTGATSGGTTGGGGTSGGTGGGTSTGGGGGGGGTTTTFTTVRVRAGKLATILRSGLVVEVPCAVAKCVVTVEVRQGKRKLASGTATLRRGGGKVTARFTRAARKRLARTRKLVVTVRIRSRAGDATTSTVRRATFRR